MERKNITRSTILIIIFIVMMLILTARLFQLQIVKGKTYAENFTLKIKREIPLKAVRGNIYDKNGKLLASNKLVYSVTFEDNQQYETNRERNLSINGKIYRVINTIRKNKDMVDSYLKIYIDESGNFQYSVEGVQRQRFIADIFGKTLIDELNERERNMSAKDMVTYLCSDKKYNLYASNGKKYTEKEREKYGLPESITDEDLLDILSIRYALSLQSFQRYKTVTIASNVSEETVAAILENKLELTGVDIAEDTIRVYEGGIACSSILGYVGKISAEELKDKEQNQDGYSINSIVGKSGMEQYLDDDLKGKNGRREVYVDNMGRIMYDAGNIVEAKSGNDVYLSIDLDLQQKVYRTLEIKIKDVLKSNIINTKYFDKTKIRDTTEIRIPIYDVYTSFFTNELINISKFDDDGASDIEKDVYHIYQGRKAELLTWIEEVMYSNNLSKTKEQKEYEKFIMEQLSIFAENKLDKTSDIYLSWNQDEISFSEFLLQAIAAGWINPNIIDGNKAYLEKDEIFRLTVNYIVENLDNNKEFDKIIYKYLVLNDKISAAKVCSLLYEQGILSKLDEDYERWLKGNYTPFSLIMDKLEKLELTPADLALDPCSGSAVVTETGTGKVLACVSYPGYDNNLLANRMNNEYYYKIYQNASVPLYNRATQQLSAPGSTFKPVTIIAGIEEGVINANTPIFCNGIFDKVEPPLKCWKRSGHGLVSSGASALQHSCNDYLCEVSYKLGMKGNTSYSDEQALGYLQKYATLFNLNTKSGIELTETEPKITDQYAIPSSIGQGTNNFATVQLARFSNTIANGGHNYALTLIDRIGESKKESHLESEVVLTDNTWYAIHTGMEWYAQNTGIFRGFQIPVAGKSGTAQESRLRPDHGLFIGYAPSNHPQIAVAVRITNGYRSENAVSCARTIFEEYFAEEMAMETEVENGVEIQAEPIDVAP